MNKKLILHYFWPLYVFLFPLIFSLSSESSYGVALLIRLTMSLLFIIVGILLELSEHPKAGFRDFSLLLQYITKNKVVFLVLLYGFWCIFSGIFVPDPALALSGSTDFNLPIPIGMGSSLWNASFCIIFVLIYIRYQHQESLKFLIFEAIAISCSFLCVAAIFEVFTHLSILSGKIDNSGQLPSATFSGRGHLAGFLVFGVGSIIFLHKKRIAWLYILPLICFTIGLTQNRASLIAVFIVTIILYIKHMNLKIISPPIIWASLILGFLTSQQFVYTGQTVLLRTQGDLTSGRAVIWKAAIFGIYQQPIFGWGGEDFKNHWADVLPKADLKNFFTGFGVEYKNHSKNFFLYKDKAGIPTSEYLNFWRAHNEILDKAIAYGIPGAILYLIIIFYAIKNGFKDFTSLSIIGYQVFLLTWFMIHAGEGPFWCVLALASAQKNVTLLEAKNLFHKT